MSNRIIGFAAGAYARIDCPNCKTLITQDHNVIIMGYWQDGIEQCSYISEYVIVPCCNIKVPVPIYFASEIIMWKYVQKLSEQIENMPTDYFMSKLVLRPVPYEIEELFSGSADYCQPEIKNYILNDKKPDYIDPMDFLHFNSTISKRKN